MSTDSFATRLLVHAPPAVQRHLYQSCSQQDVGAWPDGGPTIETGIELLELAEDHEARDRLIRQFRNPDLLVHLAEHVTELGAYPVTAVSALIRNGNLPFEGFQYLQQTPEVSAWVEKVLNMIAKEEQDPHSMRPRYGALTLSQQASLGIGSPHQCLLHDLFTSGADGVLRELEKMQEQGLTKWPAYDHLDALLNNAAVRYQLIEAHNPYADDICQLLEHQLLNAEPGGQSEFTFVTWQPILKSSPERMTRMLVAGAQLARSDRSMELLHVLARISGTLGPLPPLEPIVTAGSASYLNSAVALWSSAWPLTREAVLRDQEALLRLVHENAAVFVSVTPDVLLDPGPEVDSRLLQYLGVTQLESGLRTALADPDRPRTERVRRALTILDAFACGGLVPTGECPEQPLVDLLAVYLPDATHDEMAQLLPQVLGATCDNRVARNVYGEEREPNGLLRFVEHLADNYILPREGDPHSQPVLTHEELFGGRLEWGLAEDEVSHLLEEVLLDRFNTGPTPQMLEAILPHVSTRLPHLIHAILDHYRLTGDAACIDAYITHKSQLDDPVRLFHLRETAAGRFHTVRPGLMHPNLTVNSKVLSVAAARWSATSQGCPTALVAEEFTNAFGDDPSAWEVAIDLLDGWEGSFVELVKTVAATA